MILTIILVQLLLFISCSDGNEKVLVMIAGSFRGYHQQQQLLLIVILI
jgi:hypothetical protein